MKIVKRANRRRKVYYIGLSTYGRVSLSVLNGRLRRSYFLLLARVRSVLVVNFDTLLGSTVPIFFDLRP